MEENNRADELLKKFGLSDYINVFKEKNVETTEQVFLLTEEQILELISNADDRFKFVIRREAEYKERSSVIVNVDEVVDSSTSGLQVAGLELRILLNNNFIGERLITRTVLSEPDRKKLCEIVVHHLMKESLTIKRNSFLHWAKEIAAVYPQESELDYYNPCHKSKKNPNGKLYDFYTNLKKWMKDKNKNQTDVVAREKSADDNNNLNELNNFLNADEEKKNLWRNTASIRNKNGTIAEYFDEYPVLKLQIGIELLLIDFDLDQTIDSNIFFTEWTKLAPLILEEGTKQRVCEDLLNLEGVSNEILALFVLPYLFKPICARSKSKQFPEVWKAGKPEIAEGFIYRVLTTADLEPKWEQRLLKLRKYGLTQQPIVIAIGSIQNITNVYVSINNVKYECSDLLKAVDRCFKSFFALNADYSIDSRPVWEFLQRLYGIPFLEGQKLNTNASIVWKNIKKD